MSDPESETYDSTAEVTCRVVYTGRVQGVGFRQTTAEIARNHPVRGFVRNLSDGSVELVAQGTTSAIQLFLAAVRNRFERNVRGQSEEILDSSEDFRGFDVRR